MSTERVALIPRCAECEAPWLPADDERWQAYHTDDEPPEVVFYCPERSAVAVRYPDCRRQRRRAAPRPRVA